MLGKALGAEDGAVFAVKQDLSGLEDGILLGNLLGTEDGAALGNPGDKRGARGETGLSALEDGRVPLVGVLGSEEGIVLSKAARLCWVACLAEVTVVGLASARTS